MENVLHNGLEGETRGLFRIIWEYSWPVLGTMILNFVVGYTDVYVAGLLSPAVQAVVGFISQLYLVLVILGTAVGVGTVALVSGAVGRNRWDEVFDYTRQVLVLAFVLGCLLSVLSYVGAWQIVRRFEMPESIRPMAYEYLRIFSLALLPNYVLVLMNAIFRAVGKPRISFWIMGFVTIANVGSSFGLALGLGPLPELGYRGIALATAISMMLGMVFAVAVLFQPVWRGVWDGAWRPSRQVIGRVLRISWPAALLQVAWNAGSLMIYQFLGRLGADSVPAMAAYANGLRMEALTFLPAFALNMAAAVLVGQSLGAGSPQMARDFGRRMAGSGALVLTALSAFLFAVAPRLADVLTSDHAVWVETVRYLRINLVSVPFMVYSVVLGGAMQGAGDTLGVMKIIVFAIWIIRLPLAAFLCFVLQLGALGVWVAMLSSMILQGGLMTFRFYRTEWYRQGRGGSRGGYR